MDKEEARAGFWSRVDKSGPVVREGLTPCWMWTGGRGRGRYGVVWWNKRSDSAHRVAWTLTNGPVPDGLWVLHRCDHPGCVNPDHLWLGTHAENDADREAKGRTARGLKSGRHTKPESTMRGEAHGRAKLTDGDVVTIRDRRARGERLQSIAADFGVTDVLVSLIARRRIWRHVA
jgi:hypothetical protein